MVDFFDKHLAFDFETSGERPEYALQPWRVKQCKAWSTSLVWLWYDPTFAGAIVHKQMFPDVDFFVEMLEFAIRENRRLVGWNTVFDIQWLLAAGLDDLVMKAKWLDGMLIWKHATVEPEYELARAKRKSYSLKGPGGCVPELWPEHAGYEEEVDYHSTDEAELEKLERYNVKDVIFTLRATKHWWEKLRPEQRRCALIEAESLPVMAKANLEGVMVDTLVAGDLRQGLTEEANAALKKLAPHGVDETIVRSPQKLRHLMFDVWGLKPHHTTPTGDFSTDKETLHELGMVDPRAKVLRTYREALNNRTKFATAAIESVRYNGDFRAHPQFHVFSTYTGRLTVSSGQDLKKGRKKKAEEVEE